MVVLCYGSDLEEDQRPYHSTKQRGATAKQQSLIILPATTYHTVLSGIIT